MDWVTLALESATQLLKFINQKEARKYTDKMIKLRKDIYEEESKARPNHSFITNCEHELFVISEEVVAHAKRQEASN